MKIKDIVIGERVRKDMGDIVGFAADIKERGLLQPIGVTPAGVLIFGGRRIEACRLLGWTEIPEVIHDIADMLGAERAENMQRKDLLPTEQVAIGKLVEEQHRAKIAAKLHDTKVAAGKIRHGITNYPKREVAGSTVATASRAVGMGAGKYTRAKAVVAAAESDPEKFGDLAEQMDETGKVSPAYQEMERRKGSANGKKQRHPVHHRMHYPKPNREMERALPALDGICECLEALKPEELEASKTRGWAEALKKIASRISKVARRIE